MEGKLSSTGRRRKHKKKNTTSKPPLQRPVVHTKRRSAGTLCLAIFAVVISALGIVLYLLPCPIDPVPISLPPPPAFEGPLAPNKLLQTTEKLLVGKVVGPETLEYRDGAIFTGTGDGKVVMIKGEEITTIARFGSPPCGLPKDEHTCGRPLGLRFHTDGFLYALDAYLGLYRVNVDTGETKQLFSTNKSIEGKPLKFPNHLDIQSDGVIYFSETSYGRQVHESIYLVLENRHDGRVFKFDPKTGEISVIMNGLCIANGVQLSPDEDFLLVAEMAYARIKKYHLMGPKKGQVEIFADNLPGFVDNIRPRQAGGYWAPMAITRKHPHAFTDFFAARPWLSRLATKLLDINQIMQFLPQYGLVVALDQDGHIIDSLHDDTGSHISSVSHVLDTGEDLFLGSFYTDFLGKLSLKSR